MHSRCLAFFLSNVIYKEELIISSWRSSGGRNTAFQLCIWYLRCQTPRSQDTVIDVFHKLAAIPYHRVVKQSRTDLIEHLLQGRNEETNRPHIIGCYLPRNSFLG